MSIRGFVLGVALLAVVGWCMVQESIKQTQARYKLADLSRREGDIKRRLEKLGAEEQTLRSPPRLARLVRERKLDLVSLGSAAPDSAAWADRRRPGEVLDEDFAQVGQPVRVAAGQW